MGYHVAAGAHRKFSLTLNHTAQSLLASLRTIHGTVTVTQTGARKPGNNLRVTFKAPRRRH